jgi:microcystin-dependent protein
MATLNGLYSFTPSTAAKASEVNANFNAVKAFVDAITTGANIDGSAITESKINNGAVSEVKIANNAVTTDKIANTNITLEKLASAVATKLVPVGTIAAYAGATAPTGWLLCVGSAFSSATYPALYALLGNVAITPDLQGHTLVGKGLAPFEGTLLSKFGSTTGVATHSHANTAVLTSGTVTITDPGHAHTINGQEALSGLDYVAQILQGGGGGPTYTESTASATTGISGTVGTAITMTNVPTGTTHGNVQPSALINYIIKHD